MTSIESVTLEVPDAAAGEAFYAAAFGLGDKVRVRASDAPTTGFRGFTLSLVVSQPSTVDSLIGTALAGGATTLKPAAKGFWGYGGVVLDPGGAIWKVATSSKKETGQASRKIDDFVLLLGVGTSRRPSSSTSTAASPWRRVSAASTSSSTPRRRPSGWRSTAAGPPPKTPASPRTAPDHTGSSSAATPGPSPTRTGSRGRPHRCERAAQHNCATTITWDRRSFSTAPNHASHAIYDSPGRNVQ
jgi:hypothetical protein